MKADNNSSNKGQDNPPITGDRKVPNEIVPPMPKPERREEDNDFTKGDKNDPLRKERIDRPSPNPLKKDNDDDGENYIDEPVAEDEDQKMPGSSQEKPSGAN